jgi:hypothetical protein
MLSLSKNAWNKIYKMAAIYDDFHITFLFNNSKKISTLNEPQNLYTYLPIKNKNPNSFIKFVLGSNNSCTIISFFYGHLFSNLYSLEPSIVFALFDHYTFLCNLLWKYNLYRALIFYDLRNKVKEGKNNHPIIG